MDFKHVKRHQTKPARPTPYSFQVLAVVTRRYPGAPVIAVGYSLGGLLISHYLSENGEAAEIAAAMSISAPFHVPTSHYNLTRWNTNSLVNRCLAYWMLRTVSEHREVLRSSVGIKSGCTVAPYESSR